MTFFRSQLLIYYYCYLAIFRRTWSFACNHILLSKLSGQSKVKHSVATITNDDVDDDVLSIIITHDTTMIFSIYFMHTNIVVMLLSLAQTFVIYFVIVFFYALSVHHQCRFIRPLVIICVVYQLNECESGWKKKWCHDPFVWMESSYHHSWTTNKWNMHKHMETECSSIYKGQRTPNIIFNSNYAS